MILILKKPVENRIKQVQKQIEAMTGRYDGEKYGQEVDQEDNYYIKKQIDGKVKGNSDLSTQSGHEQEDNRFSERKIVAQAFCDRDYGVQALD